MASRSIRAAMRAWAFESRRFVSHASNVTERRISYTAELYPIGYRLSTMVYDAPSTHGPLSGTLRGSLSVCSWPHVEDEL